MKIIESVALIIVTACASFLLIEGGLLLREMRLKTDSIAGEVAGWNIGVQKTLGDSSAAMLTLAQVGAKERNAFDAQNKYFTDLETHTVPLFDAATASVTKIGNAADQFGAIAPAAKDSFIKITDDAGNVTSGLAPSIKNMNVGTAAFAANMSDPAIRQTLVHIDGVAGNLDATSSDIATFTHRELAPVRGTWNVIKSILRDFAGPAAQVGTAFK